MDICFAHVEIKASDKIYKKRNKVSLPLEYSKFKQIKKERKKNSTLPFCVKALV